MPSDAFARMDPTEDEAFYAFERKVVHIEAGAIEALRAAYAEILPPQARVLDLDVRIEFGRATQAKDYQALAEGLAEARDELRPRSDAR